MKKILILAGGSKKHLEPFLEAGRAVGVEVTIGSFGELNYSLGHSEHGNQSWPQRGRFFVGEKDIAGFDVIYFRLVGRRAEDAALVVGYGREHKIPVVDQMYARDGLISLPLKKGQEMMLLSNYRVPLPKTYFGSLGMILEKAPEVFTFPFVVKGSYGKQGHAVWKVENRNKLRELVTQLKELEREGKRFFAQEFIKITERTRVFVVGGKILGSITVPTKWRKYVSRLGYGEAKPLTPAEKQVAVQASRALGVDIAGVDLIRDNETGKVYVLEVNSAPRWARFKRETRIDVEGEIVRYLKEVAGG